MCGTTTTRPTGGMSGTSAESEYRADLERLREKEAALLTQLEGSPAAPYRLRYELELVREMIRDTRAALRRLRPSRPRTKKYSLDGQTWQWLEKQTWEQLESMDRDNRARLEWMRAVVDDGTSEMTERQRQVFGLVYRDGKKVKEEFDHQIEALLGSRSLLDEHNAKRRNKSRDETPDGFVAA